MIKPHSLIGLAYAVAALSLSCKGGCGKSESTSATREAAHELPEFAANSADTFKVVVARPSGDADRNPQIAITFSRPVVTIESLDDEAKRGAPATITPPVAGTWKWLGSSSVEFVPKEELPLATSFEVEVKAGLKAWDGATLTEGHKFSFTTPRPRVWSMEPSNQYKWVKPDTVFTITTTQALKQVAENATLVVGGKRLGLELKEKKAWKSPSHDPNSSEMYSEWNSSEMSSEFEKTAMVYVLKPAQPLALDQVVTLTIGKGVLPEVGTLGFAEDYKAEFRTYGPATFGKARACIGSDECPYGPIILDTSNAVDPKSLKDKLKITPDANLDWERVGSHEARAYEKGNAYVVLPGRYLPGTKYEVTVEAGAKDIFGQTLPAFKGTVSLSSLRPMFEPGPRLALLEDKGDGALPIESVNLKRLDTKLYKLTPETLAPLLFDHRSQARPAGAQNIVFDVSGKPNRTRTQPYDVKNALQGGKLFLVDFAAPEIKEKYSRARTVIGQITDLAVHAKLGATAGVVWVTRLSTGGVVADAEVTAYDELGKPRFTGKTDAKGILNLPALSELGPVPKDQPWQAPHVLFAAKLGEEMGVTLSEGDQRFLPPRIGHRGVFQPYEAETLGTVFTERGIYRPGETVFVKGIARALRMGKIEKPTPGTTVIVEAQDDDGNVIMKATAQVSKFGTFHTSLKIEKQVRLGYYGLYARWTQGGQNLSNQSFFRVEEYRAPQFLVDVTAEANLLSGSPLTASASARYLFGGAMAKAQAQWTIERTTASYEPPKNEPFSFGDVYDPFDETSTNYQSTNVTSRGESALDAKGFLQIEAGKAETPGDKPYKYTIEAEVTDVNRQRVANRAEIFVHPAKIYVGQHLKGSGFAESGKPVEIELVATDLDGTRQAGTDISNELKRREWKNIRKKGYGGEWNMVSEPVDESVAKCDVKSAADPVVCKLQVDKPGYYVVFSTAKDADGRKTSSSMTFYATGGGWFSWGRDDTERIELVPDRLVYKPGDVAKVLVKSPYQEAEAIITTEREGVISTRQMKLAGSATAIEVPLTEEAIPNIFVSVMLVRGRVASDKGIETGEDPGRPAVRVGYVELKVEKATKRLAVTVTPDAKDKRPRDKVKVAIDIKGHDGKPTDGEVTLWAVDEGVLRLTGYAPPDPVESIYPPRGLHVAISEPLLNLILRRIYTEKGVTPGGGGGVSEGANIRSNFKTTAHFVGDAQSTNGHADVEFSLPDNLTTFRILALVVNDNERFGLGDSAVTVSKPLLAMPALPRLMRVGDQVEAGVVVHRHGTEINSATVTVEATGAVIDGDAKKTITFTNDKPVEVRFKLKGLVPGEAKLRFSVTGSGLEDRVEQTLPVKLSTPIETVAIYGDTDGEAKEGFTPPGAVMPGVGGMDVTLAATALAGYPEAMHQLLEYPYGCVEQLSSRLVPLIALKTLSNQFAGPAAKESKDKKTSFADTAVKWLGADAFASTSVNEVVNDTIRQLQAKQNPDGGYSFWNANGCSTTEGSSFALLALSQANKAGFSVNKEGLQKAIAYSSNVAAGQRSGCDATAPSISTQVFALYALARSGAAKSALEPDLFDRRAQLGLEGKVMLADAMAVSGARKTQMKELMDEIIRNVKESPAEVHLEEASYGDFGSNTRATAIFLQALLDSSPDHPFVSKVTRHLSDVRTKGRYRTTQEAAFTLTALTDLVRIKEKATPNYTATVTLGGKKIVEKAFAGRSFDVLREKLSSDVWAGLTGATPFTFKKDGEGRLYYSATLRYAPQVPRVEAVERGILVQRWFEPYESKGKASSFIAGSLINLRVRVASRQARRYVAIDVPVPAGFELLDTSLKTTARLPRAPEGDGEDGEMAGPYDEGFYSPFNHTERRDDRVVIFSDELPAGVYTQVFALRATTPGIYELPNAHAEEMYHPEVFGTSDSGKITVLAGGEVASK